MSADIKISREQMIDLLNEDLSREYQAVIAYTVYSQTIKGAAFNNIASELEGHASEELSHAIQIARQIDYLNGTPTTVPKEARTVRSVLAECGAPPVIDYWSLDTEGSELRILKSFPFDEFLVQVLTVEHNRFPIREEIRIFLVGLGYRRAAALEIDDCYVHESVRSGSWRSRVWGRSGVRR